MPVYTAGRACPAGKPSQPARTAAKRDGIGVISTDFAQKTAQSLEVSWPDSPLFLHFQINAIISIYLNNLLTHALLNYIIII
jgi:hypothetical protein